MSKRNIFLLSTTILVGSFGATTTAASSVHPETVQEASEDSPFTEVQTYGELLKNGDFSIFTSGSDMAENWILEQDTPGSALAVANDKLKMGRQQLITLGLKEAEQVRLIQEAKVMGNQLYSWKAWHTSLGSKADLYWEALFLDADKKIIDRVKLQDATMNAQPQTGKTPANTSTVRVQLIVAGARSSNNVLEVKKASFVVFKKGTPDPNIPSKYKYTYDANGRLTLVTTGKAKIRYTYDSNGNVLHKTVEELVEAPIPEPDKPAVLPNIGGITSTNTYSFYSDNGYSMPMKGIKLVFKGWYLSQKEVSRVDYVADNALFLGQSAYGLNDEITYFNHPEYGNHNAGFKLTVDMGSKIDSLNPGLHKLSVYIHHKDGSVHKLEQKVKVEIAK
nr:RHS repeat domain-containing protein [Saccharibacillus brassicae]